MSVTLLLITVNIMVSLAAFNMPRIMETGMFVPYRAIRKNTWYELITSGFLHGGYIHLAFNMITLFFFGPVLERSIGEIHFLILYFTGLLASSIPSLIRHKDNPSYATIGASGAVEAVLFAFIVIFPFEKIYLFLIPIGIPAILFGAIFVAYSIWAARKEGKLIMKHTLVGQPGD